MLKKFLLTLVLLTSILPSGASQQLLQPELPSRQERFVERDPLDNMPILERNQFGNENPAPIPKRGPEYRKFLAASVKIAVSGASGSGTIVYFDPKTKIAYVATCGHLWTPGVLDVAAAKRKAIKCKVIVWYHNDVRLDAPRTYEADVVFYSYLDGQDTGLVAFKADWEPNYFPIGPADYVYKGGQQGHSCGCDAGTEVAHYDVKFIGLEGADLVTTENSPRPGRSGGGLMNDDGQYIGTCWGTQYRDGTGRGYFTPLSIIHKFWKKQAGYAFLLEQRLPDGIAKKLRIVDHSKDRLNFGPDYILMPN